MVQGVFDKNIRTIMISFVTFRILKLVLNKNWKDNIPFFCDVIENCGFYELLID